MTKEQIEAWSTKLKGTRKLIETCSTCFYQKGGSCHIGRDPITDSFNTCDGHLPKTWDSEPGVETKEQTQTPQESNHTSKKKEVPPPPA